MKSYKILFINLIILFLLPSCSATHKSHIVAPVAVSVSSNLNADVEVDMSRKLTGRAKGTYWFGLLKLTGDSSYLDGYGDSLSPVGKVKSAAAFNALNRAGDVDVLVSPNYIVHQTLYPLYIFAFVTYDVEVTGYAGQIKDIR